MLGFRLLLRNPFTTSLTFLGLSVGQPADVLIISVVTFSNSLEIDFFDLGVIFC